MFFKATNHLLCLFLLISFGAFSQCPPGNISFATQNELNSFLTQYPNCTIIDGNVVVGYAGGTTKSNITNLSPLSNIEIINGSLDISRNEDLATLTGLENLKSITGSLRISIHTWLTDISSLSNLTSVSKIDISHNTHLLSLDGIQNTPSIVDELIIWNNYRMEEISHLSHFTEVHGDVSISLFHSVLASLYGIHNIKKIKGEFQLKRLRQVKSLDWLHPDLVMESLEISENTILEVCQSPPICRHVQSGKPYYFYDNNEACDEIETGECEGFAVRGIVFYDTNENGLQDANEFPVQSAKLTIDGTTHLTTAAGSYSYPFNIDFPISVKFEDDKFDVTTNNEEFIAAVEPGNSSVIENNIGVIYSSPTDSLHVNTYNSPVVCGDNMTYTVQVNNDGSTNQTGRIIVDYNDEVTFLDVLNDYSYSFDDENNSIEIVLENELAPFESEKIQLVFLVEGVTSQNEVANINTRIIDVPDNESILDEDNFYGVVLCSFDPNDIQVSPNRGGENFVSDSQKLQYTIRFENKGNYYAKDILVTDELPIELDVESLEIISASHELSVLLENRKLSFIFDDIYLPATDQNPDQALEESMGYIIFSLDIDSEKVDPLSKIENEANIYFDINPAIKTNIALATIEGLPSATIDGTSDYNKIIHSHTSNSLTFYQEHIGNQYVILSAGGQLVSEGIVSLNYLDISLVPSGIYFISVSDFNSNMLTQRWVKL